MRNVANEALKNLQINFPIRKDPKLKKLRF